MADTDFEIALQVSGGDSAASAAEKCARLAQALTSAGAASTSASEAVRAAEAAYRQTESAADRAAKALEKINVAADAQRTKMKNAMEAGDPAAFWKAATAAEKLALRQAEVTKKAETAKTSLAEQAAALDKLRASATQAATAEEKVAKQLDAAKKATDAVNKAQEHSQGSGKVNEIAEGLGKLGGPLGVAGQRALGAAEGMKKLGASLGSAGPYVAAAVAIVAIVAGLAVLTVAAITATAKIAAWGVQLADANRSAELLAAGIAGTASGGAKLNDQLDDLAGRVPIAKDELRSMAATLAQTGLKGDELASALETAAEKAATTKFGPQWQKQLLSIGNQTTHFGALVNKTFGGLNIEKLLTGLSQLVSLFDSSNASGRAMKSLFEGLFQPLIDGVASWLPKARSSFIQFEIMVLKAVLAVRPFKDEIILGAEVVGVLAGILVGVLLLALVAIVGTFVVLATVAATVIAVFLSIASLVGSLVTGFASLSSAVAGAFFGAVSTVFEYLTGLSLSQLGSDLITGLANGIIAGGGAVLSAITGVVGGAIDAATSLLKINSPSKVFHEIGMSTGEGMAGGVDAGAGDVQGSLESMVAAPSVDAGGASSSGDGSAGGTFYIEINAGDAGKGLGDEIGSAVRDVLEQLGLQAGNGVPDA